LAAYGEVREEFVLEPVSGRALPVYRGEVLRILQEEGGQCVDFNAYNLHDYKERLSVARTRSYHGMFPKKGDMLWTASPRDRPMFVILEMPETCKAETLAPRCTALLCERTHGFEMHTNCQDTFAECIREWGLTPDDVHASFNMWMYTNVGPGGNMTLSKNISKKGDYVDLLALFDTLAVPITCGTGDIYVTSNFWLKPIRVKVFEPSEETKEIAKDYENKWMHFRNQRTVSDFKVKDIRVKRELERDATYRPQFPNFPLAYKAVRIELEEDECRQIEDVRRRGLLPGETDADIVRSTCMTWWMWKRLKPTANGAQFVLPSKKEGPP